jgi:hypothetical protein
LESLLEFNPYFRPTARELVKNPIFDNIRHEDDNKAEVKIVIGLDKNQPFNYNENDCSEYSQNYQYENDALMKEIKIDILREVLKLRNMK